MTHKGSKQMESYLAVENEDIQIRWYGGSAFNVFSNMRYDDEVPSWSEVDVFTHYGDDGGNPPTFEQAKVILAERFEKLVSEGIECTMSYPTNNTQETQEQAILALLKGVVCTRQACWSVQGLAHRFGGYSDRTE